MVYREAIHVSVLYLAEQKIKCRWTIVRRMSPCEFAVESERSIDSVETSLRIVEELLTRQGAAASEISEALGISRASAHSHLKTLKSMNYVVEDDYVYRPSLRFHYFGTTVREEFLDLYCVSLDAVRDLASENGEYVQVMIEENGPASIS